MITQPTAPRPTGSRDCHRVLSLISFALLGIAVVARPQAVFGLAVVAIILVPAERLMALRPQRIFRDAWLADLTHLFVTAGFTAVGLVVTLAPLIVITRRYAGGLQHAVATQPGWLQFIEALIIIETASYWGHRASHSSPVLWRFHSVHHSIEQMDWLASGRLHPIDQIFTQACVVGPLLILGFSKRTLGAYLIVAAVSAIVIHANVHWTFGPLRHLIASPQYHHWHHANDPSARNINFAGQIPLLDRVFGTHHLPNREWPNQYGINEHVPDGYLQQLHWPFSHAHQREHRSVRHNPGGPRDDVT